MTSPIQSDHGWPQEPESHLWGPWATFTGLPKASQHRQCVHPMCSAVQYREIRGDAPGPATTERPR